MPKNDQLIEPPLASGSQGGGEHESAAVPGAVVRCRDGGALQSVLVL